VKVLVPLAAQADAFFEPAQFFFPKPLIEVGGRPMIECVIENLKMLGDDIRFIFVLRAEDCRAFSLDRVVQLASGNRAEIVILDQPTDGAACSALMAVDHIGDDEPLVIANGDQLFEVDLAMLVDRMIAGDASAGVLTFNSLHPRWSYVLKDAQGAVAEAAEKRPISRDAIAGFYFFRRGRDFIRYAMQSIRSHRAVDGQYYIAPVLNEAILEGERVLALPVPENRYFSFYTPQRIDQYEARVEAGSSPPAVDAAAHPLIVVPMAGEGTRFQSAGYDKPKPFIDVAGKRMIDRVMDNLAVPHADYLLLARASHLAADPAAASTLQDRADVSIQLVDGLTEGAACTVLLGRERIDGDRPVLIANCDQIIDFNCAAFVADAKRRGLDGSILCFREPERDPKWSYARLDAATGFVTEVREKVAISDLATVGLYYFARGSSFVAAALDMIVRGDRVNGEFYVAPVYNHMIAAGLKVGVFEIPADAMHGIGTPADLDAYLERIA